MSNKVTWFYKLVLIDGRPFIQLWVEEGAGYCQTGASVRASSILNDRYFDGLAQ